MKAIMKGNLLMVAVLALAVSAAQANTDQTGGREASANGAPKNLARQHLGANLLMYEAASKTYTPTEAAAAWLDDDIATGWPAQVGKQDYLLALPEPALVNNFCISARAATGTVTLYAGDEAAAPGAKSWTLLEKDVPLDSINEKLGKPFGRFAKYILIETNVTESGPWYSIYLYGDKLAADYRVQQRAQPVDPQTIFGPYTNPQTSISVSSLYVHSKVALAGGDPSNWSKAIDDNPQSGAFVAATPGTAGLVIQFDRSYSLQRVSLLTDPGTKGKLELYVVNPAAGSGPTASRITDGNGSQYIKVANRVAAIGTDAPNAPAASSSDVSNQHAAATLNFDGTNPRQSVDFTPTAGTVLMARWTPDSAGQPLNVREIDSFGDLALNDYELTPSSVGQSPASDYTDSKGGGGKETLASEGKEALPQAVGELPPKDPFIPGVPVFPPTIPKPPGVPVLPPTFPVSP